VPKTRYAADNWFDVWLPELAPRAALVAMASGSDDPKVWRTFVTRYEREMARPDCRHLLETLAALSHRTDFSVGCYCENELRCHRSVLRRLLEKHGAKIAG
jgi:uncharacterized protein YeaO (DUF488 family)